MTVPLGFVSLFVGIGARIESVFVDSIRSYTSGLPNGNQREYIATAQLIEATNYTKAQFSWLET